MHSIPTSAAGRSGPAILCGKANGRRSADRIRLNAATAIDRIISRSERNVPSHLEEHQGSVFSFSGWRIELLAFPSAMLSQ